MKCMVVTIICCTLGVVLVSSVSKALVISCPSNLQLQEHIHPTLKKICLLAEQAIEDPETLQPVNYLLPFDDGKIFNSKRQDKDHSFLRFGRTFGL